MMILEQRVETLEFSVEFPVKNGLGFTLNKDLTMKYIQCIGSNVLVKICSEKLADIPYSEELMPEFTLEGYNQRAKKYAENVIVKIIKAARDQTAVESNVDSILENARHNLLANS